MTADTPTTPDTTKSDTPFMRVIKTYVLRAGRMGPGQTRAFEQFGPQFLVPYTPERLDDDCFWPLGPTDFGNWFWHGRRHSQDCAHAP